MFFKYHMHIDSMYDIKSSIQCAINNALCKKDTQEEDEIITFILAPIQYRPSSLFPNNDGTAFHIILCNKMDLHVVNSNRVQ